MDTQKFTDNRRSGRTTSTSTTDDALTLHHDVRAYLDDLVRTLQLMMCVVIASTKALHEQNADADADIALVLKRCCSDPLEAVIGKAEALLGRAVSIGPQGGPSALDA